MKLYDKFTQVIVSTSSKKYPINEDNTPTKNHLKISFSVEKSEYKIPNQATIKVYNLNKELRDSFSSQDNIILNAGYKDNYATLYSGDITNVWSAREGLEWVTTFIAGESFLSVKNSFTNTSFSEGDSLKNTIKKLAADMKLEFDGIIDSLSLKADETITGNTASVLDELLKSYGLDYFIADGKIKIKSNKLDQNSATVLSSDSGLLKENGVVKTDMGVDIRSMLIPTLKAGDTIYLDASYINDTKVQSNLQMVKQDLTLESLNGYYRISTAKFSGDNKSSPYIVELSCIQGV